MIIVLIWIMPTLFGYHYRCPSHMDLPPHMMKKKLTPNNLSLSKLKSPHLSGGTPWLPNGQFFSIILLKTLIMSFAIKSGYLFENLLSWWYSSWWDLWKSWALNTICEDTPDKFQNVYQSSPLYFKISLQNGWFMQ